jgi:hypothetical protein
MGGSLPFGKASSLLAQRDQQVACPIFNNSQLAKSIIFSYRIHGSSQSLRRQKRFGAVRFYHRDVLPIYHAVIRIS